MRILLLLILTSHIIYSQNKPVKSDNGYKISESDKNYGDFMWLHSDTMNLDFPVLIFLPSNYANSKKNFPVVYSLHGVNSSPLTEEGIRKLANPSHGLKEAANEFQCIIVSPLVGNKYYINSPIFKNQKYATLIATELVNVIDKKYRTIKDRKSRILQGFSMGGYGAVSLLCKYPETFSVALCRGGALDQATLIEKLQWDDASLESLGDYWQNQKEYHLHSISNLLNKIKDRNDVFIVLEVGREDFLYHANKKVEAKLKTTTIPYIYAEYPGGHEWGKEALFSLLTHLQYFVKTKE